MPGVVRAKPPAQEVSKSADGDSNRQASPARPPSSEQLAAWAGELSSNKYLARVDAQAKLAGAGLSAMPVIAELASAQDLETSTRAINVLLTWSEGPNTGLQIAALEMLAQLKNRPAETAFAKQALVQVREEHALARFIAAGGKVRLDSHQPLLRSRSPPLHFVVGPKWTGTSDVIALLESMRQPFRLSFYSPPQKREEFEKQIFPVLQTIRPMRFLDLFGTPYEKHEEQRIRELLPLVNVVEIRKGARLGVRGSTKRQGGLIDSVDPGSAADRAGLKDGDTITHVDGVEVEDFAHLTRLIAAHDASEKATLTVRRRPTSYDRKVKTEDVVVEFDRWGDVDESAFSLDDLRQRYLGSPGAMSRRR